MLRLKAVCAAVFVAAAFAAVGVGSASAGEITGSGKWIAGSEGAPLKGKSDCAYSGLNDNYVLGNPESAGDEAKAKYPLREARVTVTSVKGKPGWYQAVAHLRLKSVRKAATGMVWLKYKVQKNGRAA